MNHPHITSSIYDGMNPKPIDRLAASMFFKTPWWAEVPFAVQKAVIESRLPEERLNVDFFKAPPRVDGASQLEDMRGRVWHNKGCQLVVTGYADCKRQITSQRKARAGKPPPWWIQGIGNDWNPKNARRSIVIHYWWSMFETESSDEWTYKKGDFIRNQGSIIRGVAPR